MYCANVYRDGLSEYSVGKAVRGRRDQFVIATKVGSSALPGPNGGGLSRKSILRDLESSLRRFQMDYIDLYLCHFPDVDTTLEETLATFDSIVQQGKVRYVGCCNYPAWQLSEALCISRQNNITQFVCCQMLYNLLDRRIEDELLPLCANKKIGVTAYATTAIGLLSGQFRFGQAPPEGSPWYRGPYNYRAIMTRQTDRAIQTMIDIARERGRPPIQAAIAWCLSHSEISSVIIGADTPEQVEEDFGALDWKLSPDERIRLDAVTEGMRQSIRKDAPEGYKADEPWGEESDAQPPTK
ncbi:MAG: aldo/keto reductase [Terriglobales bacterium]